MKNPQVESTAFHPSPESRNALKPEDIQILLQEPETKESWTERAARLQRLTGEAEDPEKEETVYSCVFVESGYESQVARTIEYCGYGIALALQRIMPYRIGADRWRDMRRALLPGYIFIRGEAVNYQLRRINHVIRLLQYADGQCALRGNDFAFAERVFQTGGTIPKLQAHWEGKYVQVTDELLRILNGTVLRVDKRKHFAEIELDLVGTANRIWLGLDLPANPEKENPDVSDDLTDFESTDFHASFLPQETNDLRTWDVR